MRIAVVGSGKRIIEKELPKYGLEMYERNPQAVISFGGEGTALYAERLYPGVPRIMIRHSSDCKKCEEHDFSKVLTALSNGRYKIVEEIKVEGSLYGKKLVGLNEINIHNQICTRSIRFSVDVNDKTIADRVIGDGLVVATPYGSSAYYRSITRKTFKKGLGIAFNNPQERRKSMVVDEGSKIKVRILRGEGLLCADNNERMFRLKDGDVVKIMKAPYKARIIEIGKRRRITDY